MHIVILLSRFMKIHHKVHQTFYQTGRHNKIKVSEQKKTDVSIEKLLFIACASLDITVTL
jgi:hypothetical protein